jgi:CBS domain-containing protein
VISEGTQHDPRNHFGTIMVRGNAKQMSHQFLRGASFTGYGNTLYVGLGIPIPILNERLAKKTAIRDEEIFTNIIDYSVPRKDRPALAQVSYKELKSGGIIVNNSRIKVSSLSSLKNARKIAETLKLWIENGKFYLTAPVERLSSASVVKSMRQTEGTPFVASVMQSAVMCHANEKISAIAERIVTRSVNHIIVVDDSNKLGGIVTSWDITRAMAEGKTALADVMTRRVVTAKPDEPLEAASRRMAHHNISALPVINAQRKVLGIITAEDVSKLLGR